MSAAAFDHAYQKAKAKRALHRTDWETISRYIAPDRLPQKWRDSKDHPMIRELSDTTAISSNERLASALTNNIFPVHQAWSIPRLEGRDPSREEQVWFDSVQVDMHDFFTHRSKSFQRMKVETVKELCAFGTGASYSWAKPFGLPEYRSLSIFNCSFLKNHNGETTHFFWDTRMTRAEILAEKPSAILPGSKNAQDTDEFDVVYGITPSNDPARPWRECVKFMSGNIEIRNATLKEMPAQVAFFARRPQADYGFGPGHMATPFARWLNRIMASSVDGSEMSVRPPTFDFTGGMITKADLRPGAFNQATFAAMNMMNINEALQRFQPSGDLRPGIEMVAYAQRTINMIFYVDWMQSSADGSGQPRTATEVQDQRNERFKSLSAMTASIIPDWVNPLVERTFRILLDAGYFAPMPDSLRGESVSFEYRSPLASIINQAEAEVILNYANKISALAQLDPEVLDNFDADAAAKRLARNDGIPAELMRDPKVVENLREGRRQAAEEQAQLQQVQGLAAAGAQGAQAAASLQAVNDG